MITWYEEDDVKTHPNQDYVRRVTAWLLAHWSEWYFVLPGNADAMTMLLQALKEARVIRSMEASHCRVVVALRAARQEMRKPINSQ